jgi:hypothetical protein
MKYYLDPHPHRDLFCICQEDIDEFYVGYICPLKVGVDGPRYSVRKSASHDEIAVVKSFDGAIRALAAYYEENPPWWDRQSWSPRYIKEAKVGSAWVDQIRPGRWSAHRRLVTFSLDQELIIDGKRAVFATCEEAQRAADAHLLDGETDEMINDGFSWHPAPDVE